MVIVLSFPRQWEQVTVEDLQSGKQLSGSSLLMLSSIKRLILFLLDEQALFRHVHSIERD